MDAGSRAHFLARRRRLNRNILGTILTFALIFGITSAALFLRLSAGALDLQFAESYVRPGLQRALGEQGKADFSRLELEWVKDGLRLRVADFIVKGPDDELIAQAPGAYIGFSLLSLLRGETEPVALEIIKPVLALTIQGDGSVKLGGKPADKDAKQTIPAIGLLDPQLITRLLPKAGGEQGKMSGGQMQFLRLEDVTIVITDYRWNTTRQFDPFTVDLERTVTQGLDVSVSAPDKRGGWKIGVALGASQNGERSVKLETERFNLASLLPRLEKISISETPLRAVFTTRINNTGLASPLIGEISLDKSRIIDKDFTADIEPLTIKAQMDVDGRTVTIAPANFSFSGIAGLLSGRILLPASGDPTRPVRLDLSAQNMTFNNGTHFPDVDLVQIAGAYEMSNRTFWLDHLRAGAGEKPILDMSGKMIFVGGAPPSLELDASIAKTSVEVAKALWPAFVSTPTRNWVLENVQTGTVESGLIHVAIPAGWLDGRPLQREFVQTDWRISNGVVKLNGNVPPVSKISAQISATGNSARVDAQDGYLEMQSGSVQIPTAVFVADEFGKPKPTGRLNLVLVGNVQSLVALADIEKTAKGEKPLEKPEGFQLSKLSGEGIANAEIRVPLWRGAKLNEAKTNFEAEFRNVAADNIVDGRNLKNGSFVVKIEQNVLSASGNALIDDIPVKLLLDRDSASRTVLKAEVDADASMRKKLGLDLDPYVSGPTTIRLVDDFSPETPQHIEVDLTNATLSIPQLAYKKPAKQEAVLSFIPVGGKNVTQLDDLVLRGKSTLLRGTVQFDDKKNPKLIDIAEAHLRADDNFAARVELSGNKTNAIVTGRSIDLKPFLSSFLASNAPTAKENNSDLSVDLKIDSAIGSNKEAIKNLTLKLSESGGNIRNVVLRGMTDNGGEIIGDTVTDRGRPSFTLRAGDGGSVLRFLDFYTKIGGGQLTMTQTVTTGDQVADGVVVLDNFRIVNEPAMQKMFGASPQQQGGPKSIENDPSFDRLRVSFSRVTGAIRVNEGVLRNAAIGITFKGMVDFRRENVDIQGSFIPMYALNNLLARVPIVGLLLGGSEEGLLGVTFSVGGSLNNPILRINPVSAIAPGFLRGLFQAPTADNSPPQR